MAYLRVIANNSRIEACGTYPDPGYGSSVCNRDAATEATFRRRQHSRRVSSAVHEFFNAGGCRIMAASNKFSPNNVYGNCVFVTIGFLLGTSSTNLARYLELQEGPTSTITVLRALYSRGF